MKCLAAVAVLVIGWCAPAMAQEQKNHEQINVYSGGIDIFKDAEDGTNNTVDALVGVEYRSNYIAGGLRANLGAFVTDQGAQYYYTGIGYDVFFDDAHAWVFTPNFNVGAYRQENGKDLGGTLEFKSSLELAYQWPGQQRLGIAFQHISNGEHYDTNPGTELLTVQFAFPIHVLSH